MMRKIEIALALTLLCLWGTPVFAEGSKEPQGGANSGAKTGLQGNAVSSPGGVIIFAASNLTGPLNEAITVYKTQVPSVQINPTYGASGLLVERIEEGVPVDLFFPGASRQMDVLEVRGLVMGRRNILQDRMVLIVPVDKQGISSFQDAASARIGKIALGDPAIVSMGQYAEQIFITLGILKKVKPKAVYFKDSLDVYACVEAGKADAGVVYASYAATSPSVRIVAEAPKGSHSPVVYPAALITTGSQPDEAKAFLNWLSSREAGAIFTKYGYNLMRYAGH